MKKNNVGMTYNHSYINSKVMGCCNNYLHNVSAIKLHIIYHRKLHQTNNYMYMPWWLSLLQIKMPKHKLAFKITKINCRHKWQTIYKSIYSGYPHISRSQRTHLSVNNCSTKATHCMWPSCLCIRGGLLTGQPLHLYSLSHIVWCWLWGNKKKTQAITQTQDGGCNHKHKLIPQGKHLHPHDLHRQMAGSYN